MTKISKKFETSSVDFLGSSYDIKIYPPNGERDWLVEMNPESMQMSVPRCLYSATGEGETRAEAVRGFVASCYHYWDREV